MPERIYHYTSIESLALILSSQKIRFTRLDKVDDIREAQSHSGIEFGKYIFISCWTLQSEESIPQWHMYSRGMEGVRIELPIYPFNLTRLTPPPHWINIDSQGELFSPLSLQEMYGDTYWVVPLFLGKNQFAGPVVYTDDIESKYKESISVTTVEPGKQSVSIHQPLKLTRLKRSEWTFQKEFRFSLFIAPSLRLPPEGPGSDGYPEAIADFLPHALLTGIDPGIQHFDLQMSSDIFQKLTVRTGPLCSPGSKIIVESLLSTYAPNALLETSALSGTIRRRP